MSVLSPPHSSGHLESKGQRTRRRLAEAARRVLAERGYNAMRVTDVTAAAGVSQGTFYIYFGDKREVVLEVLRGAVGEFQAAMHNARSRDDAFDEILAPTRAYVQALYNQRALVRALLQAVDESPELARFWQETNHAWLTRVAKTIDRRCGPGRVDEQTRMLVGYALNWMVDGILHSLLARRDPYLQATVPSPEQLAEALSVLWYRAVYAQNPSAGSIRFSHDLLGMRLEEHHEEK